MSNRERFLTSLVTLAAIVALPIAASGDPLTLTAAGTSAGFTLTTVATGFPNFSTVGPTGMAFPNSGGILVSDYNGNMYRLPTDTDNQVVGAATVTGYNFPLGLVKTSNGNIYLARQNSNDVIRVNDNGGFISTLATGITQAAGIVVSPTTGHLFVSELGGGGKIVDIDPATGLVTNFVSVNDPDGLSISADGKTLYAAVRGSSLLEGFDTTTKNVVFSVSVPNIDCTALGTGTLSGKIFANLTNGTVDEIDLLTHSITVIANGGSRGDFVSVDPNNNTLLLTQTDRIMRLAAPTGGGFGGEVAPLPPVVWTALPLLVTAGISLRHKRKVS